MKRRELLATVGSSLSFQLTGCTGSECDRTLIRRWLAETDNFRVMNYKIEKDEITVTVGAEGNGGPYGFDPPGIVVRKGTEVQWRLDVEGEQYRIVDECGRFESETMTERGETFEWKFGQPGIYTYYCEFHDDIGMRGAVRVE